MEKTLLKKKEKNYNITKQQFVEDIECLFDVLKSSYGMYEYFGEDKFLNAQKDILQELRENFFETADAIEIVKKHLYSFVHDGHFTVGDSTRIAPQYDYAVKYTTLNGIPVIDCKKFYYDNEREKDIGGLTTKSR